MFKMFRYLNKYVGTYRVKAYYDVDLEDFPRDEEGDIAESFDDLYIPCKKGVIKHTYLESRGKAILCWYCESIGQGHNVYNELKTKYPDMWMEVDEVGSYDYLLYFEDTDIDKVADIVKPSSNGAKIKPYNDKNLPKPSYSIPQEDLKKLEDIRVKIDKYTYLPFISKCLKDFDEEIQKKKGKRYNIEKARRESKLKKKDFVHSIGMWNDFIKFVEGRLDGLQ